MELSEPNENRLPRRPVSSGIDVSLGQNLRSRGLQACLDSGESTEPHQIKTTGSKGADRRGIVADGQVANPDVESFAQLISQRSIEPIQPFRILIGDCTHLEDGLCHNGQNSASLAEKNGKQDNGPAFS